MSIRERYGVSDEAVPRSSQAFTMSLVAPSVDMVPFAAEASHQPPIRESHSRHAARVL